MGLGNLMDVETETSRDWSKDVDTETSSRLLLISAAMKQLGYDHIVISRVGLQYCQATCVSYLIFVDYGAINAWYFYHIKHSTR